MNTDKSQAEELARLTQRAMECEARTAKEETPPSPEELAEVLAQCRALAGQGQATQIGERMVELILMLSREVGPQYLAALDQDKA